MDHAPRVGGRCLTAGHSASVCVPETLERLDSPSQQVAGWAVQQCACGSVDRLSPGTSLSTCGGTEARGGCYDTEVVTVTAVSAGVAGSHPAPLHRNRNVVAFPDAETLFHPDIAKATAATSSAGK